MARFILRRLGLLLLTMFIVSVAVFAITEAAPGNIARNVLGAFITEEQQESFLAQMGLDKPPPVRYFYWLVGNDWLAERRVGLDVTQIRSEEDFVEWWALEQDQPIRWKLEGEDLVAQLRQPDGSIETEVQNWRWEVADPAAEVQRLTQYQQTIQENVALPAAERQDIVRAVDEIIQILENEALDQAQLAQALQGPEGRLEALMAPEAATAEDALTSAGDDLVKDSIYQAVQVRSELEDPAIAEAQQGDLNALARRLHSAADLIETGNPGLAFNMRAAASSLETGDLESARPQVADFVPALENLSGAYIQMVDGLRQEDYNQAVIALHSLADPAQTPFDATRLAIVPQQMETAADALEDVDEALGASLEQASENLAAGESAVARENLSQAAAQLEAVVQVIEVTDSASNARVIRHYWGVDTQNHAVLWEKGGGREVWQLIAGSGLVKTTGGPVEFIPLQKGLLRGDPGLSLRTQRPVADTIFRRLRNSLVLAGIAFVVVMPLALVLGLIAGLNEGKLIDRVLTIGGLVTTVTPEFATGIFLILIFAQWLKLVPGATVFGEQAPWERPDMLILPVLTLTLLELGYILRITRASMVDVMKTAYIRSAYLKGLPYWRIVFTHAIRNALIAPITVIMLHVNWLLGGIVVVEVIFGYPGLGKYLLDSALFKDFNAIEAGAMVLVAVAVGTQLLADIVYTFLNPRIRYT